MYMLYQCHKYVRFQEYLLSITFCNLHAHITSQFPETKRSPICKPICICIRNKTDLSPMADHSCYLRRKTTDGWALGPVGLKGGESIYVGLKRGETLRTLLLASLYSDKPPSAQHNAMRVDLVNCLLSTLELARAYLVFSGLDDRPSLDMVMSVSIIQTRSWRECLACSLHSVPYQFVLHNRP